MLTRYASSPAVEGFAMPAEELNVRVSGPLPASVVPSSTSTVLLPTSVVTDAMSTDTPPCVSDTLPAEIDDGMVVPEGKVYVSTSPLYIVAPASLAETMRYSARELTVFGVTSTVSTAGAFELVMMYVYDVVCVSSVSVGGLSVDVRMSTVYWLDGVVGFVMLNPETWEIVTAPGAMDVLFGT